MNNRTEQLIILKLQSGDPEAYQELYSEYSEPIFRFIYFRVTDRETALDLSQEVFLKFMKVTDKERITNISAYLYRIARNLVIDLYRRSEQQEVLSLEKTNELVGNLGKESIEARIDLELVIKAASKLKPLWKEIVLLRFVDGLEFDEIAQVVGKSENYIRVNLHRALKQLKSLFEEIS